MAIQILRGDNSSFELNKSKVLQDGQPFYNISTNKLYIGHDNKPLEELRPVSGNNDNISNSDGEGSLYSTIGNGTEDTRASGVQSIAYGKGCVAESSRALSLQRGNRVSEYITGYVYDASGAKVLDDYLINHTSWFTQNSENHTYSPTDATLRTDNIASIYTTMNGTTGANACSAFGQLQQVAGNCSVAFGKQNKIYANGAQSFVCGLRNRLDSYQSSVFGRDNSAIDGRYNQFIVGRDNIAKHDDATLIGAGLKSSPIPNALIRPQTVVGRFNNEDTDALFIVGSGFDNNKRYNTFTVTTYGAYVKGELHVNDYIGTNGTVQATGIKINGNPVATETYVDDKAATTLASAKSYANTQINNLDYSSTGSTTKTITSLSQTDGKISATYSNIAFPVTKVAGKTGAVSLVKGDVGLGNVDNTSDATKKANFTGSITETSTGFVTGEAVYTELNKKADKATTYTKSETEALLKEAFKWDATSGILTIDSTKIGA